MFTGVVALLAVGVAAHAATPGPEGPALVWRPVLELRPRFRVDLPDVGAPSAALAAALRARVGMDVSRGILAARVSMQDVRGWNDTGSISYGRMPNVGEAWAQIDATPSDNLGVTFTVGRQPLQLEDGRLIGTRDWSMKGQFLDGARLELIGAPLSVEVINARRYQGRRAEPFGAGITALRLGIGRDDPANLWQIDAVGLVDARDSRRPVTTAGGFGKVESGRFRGRLEAYGQGDAAGAGTLLGARVGWVFGPEERVVLYGEGGVESGGAHPWQQILGDQRAYHGLLGLPGAPADGDGSGALTLDCRLSPRLRLDAAVRQDIATARVRPLATTLESDLHWYVSPFAAFSLGGAFRAGADGLALSAAGYGAIDVKF